MYKNKIRNTCYVIHNTFMQYHVELDIDLKRNPYKGLYIALEGIDGSGKTTQVEELTKYFEKQGKTVVATREPRKEGLIGDIVQKVLTGTIKMSPIALQYLFSTDRVLHHDELVIPALKAGKIVISDRCFWSAVVYGILDRNAGKYDYKATNFLLMAHSVLSMYHQFIIPDYTFCLKVPLSTSVARISKKDDMKEIYEDREKLQRVIEGYDWLSKKFTNEITVVDGNKSVEEVTRAIVARIK